MPPLSPLSSLTITISQTYEFNFPRPENEEEIEVLFENIMRLRGLDDIPHLSNDQKWHIVYNDEQMRWGEERKREEQARKQNDAGQPPAFVEGTPEWYIKRFMDRTITPKQASSLQVSLRSKEMSWFRHFVDLQGTSVLGQALQNVSRKGVQRRKEDIEVENEVAKCLKQILNHNFAANDALNHPTILTQIASALNTPHLPTRKILLDLLCFLEYYDDGKVHNLVVSALEALSAANNEAGNPYAYWFKSLEIALAGRGKMGTLVGASDEVKRHGGVDSSLNDYALSNLFFINGLMRHIGDLDIRVHHRAQMEAAGLQSIVEHCWSFGVAVIDKQLQMLQQALDEDEAKLKERIDQEILRDLANPEDVYNALRAKTAESKAKDHFLSILQHMLLIREEGPALAHYYQLIDSLVADIVLDKKLVGAEQRLGHSVERIIAQFNEADRHQQLEEELALSNASALRLRLEKEALEEEVAQGEGGLVGSLKAKVARLEEKLAISRENTQKLQGQMEVQKAGYEEQIAQLEAQIMELFRMLKEVSKGVGKIIDHANAGGMDRKTLIDTLERHFQRDKTISILEGRGKRRDGGDGGEAGDGTEDEETPRKGGSLRRNQPSTRGRRTPRMERISEAQNGHTSQFMDADDEIEQEQIQQQIAEGAMNNVRDGASSSPRSARTPSRRNKNLPRTPLGSHFVPESDDRSGSLAETIDDFDGDSELRRTGASPPTATWCGCFSPASASSASSTSASSTTSTTSTASAASWRQRARPSSPSSSSSPSTWPTTPHPPPPGKIPLGPLSGPGSARTTLLGANIQNLLSARKDISITPSTKMKQLQWDKIPLQQAEKTVFKEPTKEDEWVKKLQLDGVWMEMEEDFKAKQLVINLMAKQKRAELKSVLDPQTKKRVEILIQTVKKFSPEELAFRIRDFDQEVCTQLFLSELKRVLPNPEQIGKLNVYRNADPEELASLHPSDRLMVQLLKINRLAPRIEGMLYKCVFDETWGLLDDSARKLSQAGKALLDAKHLKELLSLILLIGNYMNGTGIKGGAFGFRVSSINKLVDTKSLHNTTLLHFLERTVAKHFPDMEAFLDELAAPAEAYRVNLLEVRKSLSELREGLKNIRKELTDNFSEMDINDKYGKKMWSFIGKATSQLEDLIDDVNHANNTFSEVVKYYGEDEKNINSAEFYGIFKTFVTSYKKCRADNLSITEEREAVEKRRQAAEDARANKVKQKEANHEENEEDNAALDNLLEKLRNGDSVGPKARRARKSTATRQTTAPLTLNTDILLTTTKSGDETIDIARDMLMRLKSDGFDALMPSTPTIPSMRRSRRKRDSEGMAALAALGESISSGGTSREESESSTTPSIILDSIEEHPSPVTG
ncbi:hypothetical protein LXA43DRAFT_1159295 [Ganoderma leucocontextum]|nr:hypothetical protein LXA43DRAFT_1159295 [Ganoderma leucocontextum]